MSGISERVPVDARYMYMKHELQKQCCKCLPVLLLQFPIYVYIYIYDDNRV